VVLDGGTGILVPSEDVESLATAIRKLLQDSALRERFGAAGRKRIEDEFSAKQMAADYLRVYDEAAASGEVGGVDISNSSTPVSEKDKLKRVGQ
jgi:glycosyltransferase involved in cell wall biosynthesis